MSSHQISLFPYGAGECPINADRAFGAIHSQACRALDFTLMFEQTILSIVPSLIFIVLAVWTVFHLHRCPLKIAPTYSGIFKAVKFSIEAPENLALTLSTDHCHYLCNTTVVTPSLVVNKCPAPNFSINPFSLAIVCGCVGDMLPLIP